MKKILFFYPTNRNRALELVRSGESPDNELYGLNYFNFLGWQASFADVSPVWQNFLDKVFFLFGRLFREQIDITFQLGRALLMLPAMNRAEVILTNTDSIGLPVCFLKRLGLVKPPVIYAVGLFYIQGKLKRAVDAGEITLFRRFYTWILSAADHIIYHSPIEKEKLIKLGLYNPSYCTFVAMGSDARFFQNRANSEFRIQNSELVLAVGRDHARDYKILFEAAEKLADVEFAVICSRRNVEGLSIPGNVKVLLDLSYREVADWYRRATAVVIPMREMYRSSGQMTLTDSFQARKPIVASNVMGISHYGLRNGIDAILVAPDNPSLLQGAVRTVVDDKNLRSRLENQTEKLSGRFTTENYARNIAEAVNWATDRLRLRPIWFGDLEFVRRVRNDNRRKFLDDAYVSRSDQRRWFENYKKKTDDYMFVLKDNGRKVGVGAIYNIDLAKKSTEVGRFVIDKQFQGMGYGKILVKKILSVAKNELRLDELRLEVFGDNKKAMGLYRSAGFNIQKTGKTRNGKTVLMVQSFHAADESE
ncbi:GNAT family N-acetyltransferase [Candidatus Collierbacteria bacterium]|nr:GNAT family N-acetyltransferase [Candidatus Collierbacteria bacterium]